MTRRKTLLLLAGLAGCASLPERHIYVLGSVAEPAAEARDNVGRPVIEVRRVLVPDYLDSTDILLRTGTNELKASETGAWGERLSVGITRALTNGLAQRVPSALVVSRPQVGRASLLVLVDVTALGLLANGECVLAAHWTLLRPGDSAARPLARAEGRFVTRADGSGDAAIVAAINRAVDELADRIAAGVRL